MGFNGIYPLVNIEKAMENGHRKSGFFPMKNFRWIFPWQNVNVHQRVNMMATFSNSADKPSPTHEPTGGRLGATFLLFHQDHSRCSLDASRCSLVPSPPAPNSATHVEHASFFLRRRANRRALRSLNVQVPPANAKGVVWRNCLPGTAISNDQVESWVISYGVTASAANLVLLQHAHEMVIYHHLSG